MGPLEMLYGWQALLCAAACVSVTQLVKAVIDTVYERKWEKMSEEAQAAALKAGKDGTKTGTIARRQSVIVTRFVLPMCPILVGIIYANVVPFRPEVLVEYMAVHVDGWAWEMLGWAAWGAACGQFSAFLFDRLQKILESVTSRAAS